MYGLTTSRHGALSRLAAGRYPLARRDEPFGSSRGLLVAGVVALGVGFLAWHYLGPDVRRYIKIREM